LAGGFASAFAGAAAAALGAWKAMTTSANTPIDLAIDTGKASPKN
jgi:hypothetical protein